MHPAVDPNACPSVIVPEASSGSLRAAAVRKCPVENVGVNFHGSHPARHSLGAVAARMCVVKVIMPRYVTSTMNRINRFTGLHGPAAVNAVVLNEEKLIGSIPRIIGP